LPDSSPQAAIGPGCATREIGTAPMYRSAVQSYLKLL